MQKLGMQEGEPIENNMVSRAIENAQKRVEGHHFEIRKTLLDYDNVMNQQRTVIYSLRRDLMQEPDLEPILNSICPISWTICMPGSKFPRPHATSKMKSPCAPACPRS